jgi:dolichol-phosphate mannosyltransferase
MTPCLYIVVPILNERGNMPRLVEAFSTLRTQYQERFQVQIILVDDGSTDGGGTEAQSLAEKAGLNFMLLRHEVNQGPGRAFGTALEYLAGKLQESDWVLMMEGDNTSRHELVQRMFQRSEEGFSVILASVYMYGGGIDNTSFYRVVLSNIANVFAKEFLGLQGLMTISSFFRLHRAPIVMELQKRYGPRIMEQAGFEALVEMLMKMVYLDTTISEVPMMLDTKLRVGRSKMRIGRTIFGYFALLKRVKAWKESAGVAPK